MTAWKSSKSPATSPTKKVKIAKNYLAPRQIEENGLRKTDVRFTESGLAKIIQGYTREAGVRKLEQQIAAVCRKLARAAASGRRTKFRSPTNR